MGVILNLSDVRQHVEIDQKAKSDVFNFELIIFPGVRYERHDDLFSKEIDDHNGKNKSL